MKTGVFRYGLCRANAPALRKRTSAFTLTTMLNRSLQSSCRLWSGFIWQRKLSRYDNANLQSLLCQVEHWFIVICWWNESHELHQCCRPRRYSQTRIQFQFIFPFVFRIIDNSRNRVQRVGCFWFWLTVCAHCNRTVFFVFVQIVTVSVVSCKTEDTTSFSIAALRLFLCQQLFKSSLTFFIDFNLYYAIF